MTGNEYQVAAMRTNDGKAKERLQDKMDSNMSTNISEVLNAALGLSGEVGELNDMIKKFIFHGHAMDEGEFKKEIGDILWYLAMMCKACGYNLDVIMEMNIQKLLKRYPEGFDSERSKNRVE